VVIYDPYFLKPKHKVFISYYHQDDQYYKILFENTFSHVFLNKSVKPGDIATDNSDEYIKKLIREDYISDSSVVLVLVGPNTKSRKHVDWEIYAGLDKKANGYSGLLGILLPSFPRTYDENKNLYNFPPRLADNVKSGYANIYTWEEACASDIAIRKCVQETFDRRITEINKICNGRSQAPYDGYF
jgi:hypothetical protein